jgi:hypothetical protein
MLIRTDTLVPWRGEALNGVKHPKNIEVLWTVEDLAAVGLVKAIPFEIPEGYHATGSSTYDATGQESRPIEAIPPKTPTEIADELASRIDLLVLQDRIENQVLFALYANNNPTSDWADYRAWIEGFAS